MLIPNEKKITEQVSKIKKQKYRCVDCNGEFTEKEIEIDQLPERFFVFGLGADQKVPKCPHCKALAFFGFETVEEF